MKKRNLLSLLTLTLFGQLFYSCNSARQYEFSNRSEAYHSEKAVVKSEPQVLEDKTVAETSEKVPANLTASTTEIMPVVSEPLVTLQKAEPAAEIKAEKASENQKLNVTKAGKKELIKALKQLKKEKQKAEISGEPTVDILELIFAIIIPPIGVLLHEEGINGKFWLSILLTILFYFPGMIYALLVVTDTI